MDQRRLPNRRSIRLRGFDYARNHAYFVTICTTQKLCLLGELSDGKMALSPIGQIADDSWLTLPSHTVGLLLDAWVIMPNHLHGIIVLPGIQRAASPGNSSAPGPGAGSLGAVIGGFKSAVSREVNARNLTLVRPIWQRNYYERIIRDDREFDAVRRYIEDNPARWDDDPDHPRHQPVWNAPPRL